MLKKLVVLAVVVGAAAGLGVGTASADGPKNEHEAAVCRSVVGSLINLPLDAVCAVQAPGADQ